MTTLPNYHRDIVDNPVQRHENSHVKLRRIPWFWRAVYAISVFALVAPLVFSVTVYFHEMLELSFAVFMMINIVAVFLVEMRIINQAGDAIRREFYGKTWELLLMTGVDTWRLIIGKWLGVLRGNRRDIIFLYALRVVTFLYGVMLHNLLLDGFRTYYRWRDNPMATITDIRFDVMALTAALVVMAIFLMLELLLVASLPLGFSLFRRTRKNAPIIALGLRIAVPIALMVGTAFMVLEVPFWFTHIRPEYPDILELPILGSYFSLFDNGVLVSVILNFPSNFGSSGSSSDEHLFIIGQLLGIGLYVLWIWIMLRFAKYAAWRRNVSTPGFVPKSKPKRMIETSSVKTATKTPPVSSNPKPREPKVSNLLGIDNPVLYRCKVTAYDDSLSQLAIRVYPMTDTQPAFNLQFTGVSFFTGAMNWDNAKFEVLSDKHLKQFADNQRLDYDTLPNNSKLYVVQSQGNRVRVIASDVRVDVLQPEPV